LCECFLYNLFSIFGFGFCSALILFFRLLLAYAERPHVVAHKIHVSSLGLGETTIVAAIGSTHPMRLTLQQLPDAVPPPPTVGVTGFREIRWYAKAAPAEVCQSVESMAITNYKPNKNI
jgi:hypothetical protein